MSHAIKEHDTGAVGFTKQLGNTWHLVSSYKHFDNEVNIEIAERVIDYPVEKKPLFFESSTSLNQFKRAEKAYCLYRPDKDIVLFPNVGESYRIIPNTAMLYYLENILATYSNLKIESVGTLNNGQNIFINLNVVEHTVKGDISPTITRLMFTNSYGGAALSACLHQTRVVCMNTVRLAEAQGKANETLRKFSHTKNATDKVYKHVMDLSAIVGAVKRHNEQLDYLATKKVTAKSVDKFLEQMFPTKKVEGRQKSIAENKQMSVRSIFESKPDLKAIRPTSYRLLNAITDFTSHEMSITDKSNRGKRFMNVAQVGGAGDKLNQKALELLTI